MRRSSVLRYGIAVISVALVLMIKLPLNALIGHETPFLLFFGAVMLSAYYGGMGPGIVTTLLSALSVWYFFLHPDYSLVIGEAGTIQLAMFAIEGVLISSLSAALITARRRAESSTAEARQHQEISRQNEERYRIVAETASDAIITIDEKSTILFVNPAAERIFGHRADELLAQNLTILMPEYLRHLHRAGMDRYVQTGRRHISWEAVELPGLHKSGREIPLELSFGVSEAGDRHIFTGIARDITERKRAEREREELLAREREAVERREESLALLEVVLATAPVGLAFFDREFRYIRVNECLAAINGVPVEEHLGRRLDEVLPALARTLEPLLKHVFETGKAILNLEVISETDGGGPDEQKYYIANYYPVRAAGGEVVWVGAVIIDVTERRRAEEERLGLLAREHEARKQAEAANRLKDEFLATLSHELRTPLTSIYGWARLLRAGDVKPEDAARALEAIERNAEAQKRLIDDILDVSRIITGKLRLNIQSTSLVPVIEAAVDAVRPAADAKHIKLDLMINPEMRHISADPDRLQQVVWNLLSNAIKFTPKNGRVDLRLDHTDSAVQIRVSDTGQGIEPQFLPFVFERFRQADASSTRKHGGLGLGLAIVRHIVELHGGTVSAESVGRGMGATFTVALPLVTCAEAARLEPPSAPTRETELNVSAFALRNLRVLVVDDEADTLEFLTAVLEKCGAQVTAVDSAAKALRAFEEFRPDVLISDIGMPAQDGYTLIRHVRALGEKQGGRVPAIALTAYAHEEDRLKALRAGFQMHLPKPVAPRELAAVVASFCGRTEPSAMSAAERGDEDNDDDAK